MSGDTWGNVLAALIARQDLSYETAHWVMDQVMNGEAEDAQLGAFLGLMEAKGPSVIEVQGLADAMQGRAHPLDVPTDVVDIVGTGGDQAKTVNISTMASLVIASTDTPLVKHGNRASTSACGSADVIEALGVDLAAEPDDVAKVFDTIGITFCFANLFHPSMRYAAATRRALGFPTVFNILGPMTNPARPRASAVGVAKENWGALVSGVFANRGTSALVFRGKENGLDELTTTSINQLWEVHEGHITYLELDACKEFSMEPASLEDLRGADAHYNAGVLREIFNGKRGPIHDAVVLNAAAGIAAYGALPGTAPTDGDIIQRLAAGLEIAREAIDSGKTTDLLQRWVAIKGF
ncbi:MAG: anthranilate phosphoribosyltransferase [Actinomycetaceae bacterium]|nr:anthranilate phosphoribosyltransferase [Actinomycetaceae bacterium]